MNKYAVTSIDDQDNVKWVTLASLKPRQAIHGGDYGVMIGKGGSSNFCQVMASKHLRRSYGPLARTDAMHGSGEAASVEVIGRSGLNLE
jgi:hypothetical protein